MALNPRVSKAFNAMKVLGIPKETIKPVLKNLLKLYDNNWELIEDDNYRTLADAIFESADEKKWADEQKDGMENDGSEPPLKKLRLEQLKDQVSPRILNNVNTILDLEDGEEKQTSRFPKLMESSQSCIKHRKTESNSHCLPMVLSNKGKDPISSDVAVKVTKSSSQRASTAGHSNQLKGGTSLDDMLNETANKDCYGQNFVVPKRKRPVTDGPHLALSTSVVCSGTLEGSSTGNSSADLASPFVTKEDITSACISGAISPSNLEIASSPSGEVKIFLVCNSARGPPNFHAPKLDAVLKCVENKYLESCKIVGSQLSVTKLLKDLCQSYLELGTNSTDASFIKSAPVDYLPCIMGTSRETPGVSNSGIDLITKQGSHSESSSLCRLAVSQQQTNNSNKKRCFRKIKDITKGTERVRISLLDEIGSEQLPNFIYVPENIVYQNAYIHFSLARIADDNCCSSCSEDCLSTSVPCECARDTRGEFAYTPQGLLREEFLSDCISMNQEPQNHYHVYCTDCPLERAKNGNRPRPCKGHLVRKFIKECWRKCGCNMHCGNRVVQRGITCKLQVFQTDEGKGWGVRTLQDLPKGSFVCEYVGEILTNMELFERNEQSSGNERHTYPVLLDADWGSEGVLKDEEALCLDATSIGNVARFINHRCFDANLLDVPVEVETPDHHYYHLAFFTTRKVEAFEELTWDYGIDFNDHSHPIKAFQCCCGSAFCRDTRGKGKKSSVSEVAATSRMVKPSAGCVSKCQES
ncbi:probable inactive histone-lysine N-methyltransferase SUVR2 isoform X2 [Diospyros lotus]|uniref:probable inactive histone-lysine N-methyltransferase SUVR2 isoform X2 n=1 Tax=Diospyros lotus TaxID=55363 RepID=UPI00224F3C3C|nr:probable inactive histone-lysine N-methyltransferase SUVR2 isoform X2 [Diospyros lotus]